MRALFNLLGKTFSQWSKHKAPRLGAALAYYTIFSLSPLLIIVIAIAGLVFGPAAAQNQIIGQIQGLIGQPGAALIQTMIQNAYRPSTNIVLTVVGLVTLLLGAAGVFGELQDSLNTIWEVPPAPGRGILGMVRDRLLSFGLLLATGFLLLVSLVASAGLQALATFFGNVLPVPLPLLEGLNLLLSFAVITLLFALILKFLPDARIAWRDVWIGAAITSLLFTVGKFLIGFYLGRSSVASVYGAAGALVILLLWIYYSAQILFFGAEFTRVYADEHGSRVRPKPGAIPATNPSEVGPGASERPPHPSRSRAAREAGRPTLEPQDAGAGAGEPRPARLALVRRQLVPHDYRRDLAVLLGFLAGAVVEARVLRHDRQDGDGRR